MKKKSFLIVIAIILGTISIHLYKNNTFFKQDIKTLKEQIENEGGTEEKLHPLSIEYMRKQEYPGSDIVIEQTLPSGSNYNRYIASYKSDGLKIYALLTIPIADPSPSTDGSGQAIPKNGWPVVIFNHGYIPPAEYRTTERYIAYTDAFSRNGYVVFRPDYRGHGNSEGNPEGAYYSPAYTIDVLNAVSSIKKLKDPSSPPTGGSSGQAQFSPPSSSEQDRLTSSSSEQAQDKQAKIIIDPNKIGMWGHSMGGSITLRSMVTTSDIKAGVIWAGVVASYEDMAKNWHRSRPWVPSQREQATRRPGRQSLIDKYGDFDKNPQFWNSISPISHVSEISGTVQIHHGTADEEVPVIFSKKLNDALKNASKEVEYYVYEGDDHNISANLDTALERSVEFFDKHLK